MNKERKGEGVGFFLKR